MMLIMILMFVAMGYVGWHLWMLVPLPVWGKWCVVGVEVLCVGLALLAVTRQLDRMPMGLASAVYNVGNKALIVLLYVLMLCLVVDVLRLVRVMPTAWVRDNWWACGAAVVLLAAVFVYGSVHYRHKVRVSLDLDRHGKMLAESRPLKLVAMSDLHLGYHNRRAELARWVDLINAERPDVVLIAGDVIDRSVRPLWADDMAAELRRVEAPIVASLGNHEYYAAHGDPGEVERFYREAGITLLRDSAVTVAGMTIIGRDDRTNSGRLSIGQLKARYAVADTQYTLLLDHQPYHLEEAERQGIDLQLSGHTHRGQVWPLSWVTDALYECSWGYLRKGGTDVYVSSGLGIWGAKYRIGTQSEYVVIEIGSEEGVKGREEK